MKAKAAGRQQRCQGVLRAGFWSQLASVSRGVCLGTVCVSQYLKLYLKLLVLTVSLLWAKAASMTHPKEVPPEAILLAVYLELQNGE